MVFSELPIRRAKKAMAQNFYSLLVLQKVGTYLFIFPLLRSTMAISFIVGEQSHSTTK